MKAKRILLGVTGGIAAYKAATLARALSKAGCDVRVVMTEAATRFVTPVTLQALTGAGVDFSYAHGDGAFYGPKLEFHLTDAIGRTWQAGTFQLDYIVPQRLGASYIDETGAKKTPVMLHRAVFGTFERFIGLLLEQYSGKLPYWLSPQQAVVATITSDADDYARDVERALKDAGLRAESDLRNEKINYKVREHSLAKIPAILVVGAREAEERKVSIRRLGSERQEVVPRDAAIALLADEATPPDLRGR